jgi:flagellar motor switch protein FliN/FliY
METKVKIEKAGEENLLLFLAQGTIQGGGGKKADSALKASPEKKKSERSPVLNGVESNKIDLLLDLELPVMVRIGSTELKIIDIMKLGIGSIIELEKHVDDPVDLLVNDRLVARGEVVIYENNFGIRILEVVSKEERIKSLGG